MADALLPGRIYYWAHHSGIGRLDPAGNTEFARCGFCNEAIAYWKGPAVTAAARKKIDAHVATHIDGPT